LPASKTAKPWNTVEWKKRRAEILAVRDKCEWCGLTEHQSLEKYAKGLSIDHIMPTRKGDSFERYMGMMDEEIQVLCSGCHYQKTRGFALCAKCRATYHPRRHDACYECNREKIEGRRSERERESKADAENEKHHREFCYGVDHPEIQHLRLWHCDECREPIDFEHLCAYQCCDICLARFYAEAERNGYEQKT